jgi:hypothetical protein
MKWSFLSRALWVTIPISAVLILVGLSRGRDKFPGWVRLSSRTNDLPVPGTSPEQTGMLAARLDPDSPATDFVMSFRVTGPALVWYRRIPTGWLRYPIEPEFLTIEAGGAAYDIDGDGDLDIVFGNDWQGDKLWWWENPYPNYDPNVPWKRHVIKDSGAKQHHDQVFADIKGTGKPQLIFWNQQAKSIYLADIPNDPRHTEPWPYVQIFNGNAGEGQNGAALYAEGMDAYDIDGDGKVDLLAGNYWFHHEGGNRFRPIRVGLIGGRIRAGRFKRSKYPQIVIAPGDGSGPLMIYECKGDPMNSLDWQGRKLLDRDMIHGHTLELGDVNGDGHLDILTAEQGKWNRGPQKLDNPDATAWILYGDGKGGFTTSVLDQHEGWHDGKLADVDGDGDLDAIQKPYAWDVPRIDVWLNHGTGNVRTWKPRQAPATEQGASSFLQHAVAGTASASLKGTLPLDGKLYHVQGIDLDKEHLWVTSVDAANHKGYLHQFNRKTGKFERQLDLTDGVRFHPGGFSIRGNSIWLPVAEYQRHSTAILEEIDKRTLTVKRKFTVADHIGCVAISSDTLIAGNWDSRQFYVLDFEGKQLRIVDSPQANHYQDIKFMNGMLVASGVLSHTSGAVDWLAWPSLKLVRRIPFGVTDQGVPYTAEGMAIQGQNLYLLPENGPSRLFHFLLTKP